ncbi:hypothetical protein RI129_002730 [Pyrocoelia pectoralis]|uniref:DDE Tnp4 domain-containing protein n=1 Tax=Pyrocoelia pectoralis TaxID=417401 RepID=A0AAN7VNI5_9COLE
MKELKEDLGKSNCTTDASNHNAILYSNHKSVTNHFVFLWFVGHQTASFADVSDRFNITKSSLERIINRQTIRWPSDEEKVQIEREFRENGFGNVIGAIDGSHVKIDKPQNDPDSYINRKGYYSIQVQVVCDKKLRIRDIFIGYPGSVHDSRVFRNSPLYETLPAKCGEYFILGDSGYPLKANLLTSLRDRGQLNNRQANYNLRLATNRYVLEHCFGILKQKFRQLYHVKLRKIEYIVHLIRAACVLHNLALDDELLLVEDEEIIHPDVNNEHNDNIDNEEEFDGDGDARRIRDAVVNS